MLNKINIVEKEKDFKPFYITVLGNITQISVPHNVRMVEINNLKKDACYLVWMASVSRASMSNSTAVIVRKPSSLSFLNLLTALMILVIEGNIFAQQ